MRFSLLLEKALGLLCDDAQQAGAQVGTGVSPDPALKKQQDDAEKTAQNKVGANTPGGKQVKQPGQQSQQQNNQQDQRAQAQKQQQVQQTSQLSTSMANYDKQIAQLQAKIQGGAAKPAEVNKLNQLLTAKKSVQDQLMRLYGVPTT